MLERLLPKLARISGMVLRVDWDGPKEAADAGEVPKSVALPKEQDRLLHRFSRMLLLDSPFRPERIINVGDERVRLSDAAVVLGLSYGPAPAPARDVVADADIPAGAGAAVSSDSAAYADTAVPSGTAPSGATIVPAEGTAASADTAVPSGARAAAVSRSYLRLIAGEWLSRSLLEELEEPPVTDRPSLLVTTQLLATMRSFGGTMRGRPFELLCADALCFRSLTKAGAELRSLLPHLSRSKRGGDRVPRLQVVALPKATRQCTRLDDATKLDLLRRQDRWSGASTIHIDDLPWLLSEWLREGYLGVPADAQSGSQDSFLRLSGGVVGFAFKAVIETDGIDWSVVRDELTKAPKLPAHLPYTLVLWSLHLAPELRKAVGTAASAVYARGDWHCSGGELKLGAKRGASFSVAASQELIVANPHAPCGGGLQELLGSTVLDQLRAMKSISAADEIAHLADWAATASAAPSPPQSADGWADGKQ